MILTGISMLLFGLLALVFTLGKWYGERAAARAHVRNLDQQRRYLADQRAHLEDQRAHLEQQRAHLDVRRRTARMPDSGRAPAPHVDDQPTRDLSRRVPRVPEWLDLPDGEHKRGHRRYDEN